MWRQAVGEVHGVCFSLSPALFVLISLVLSSVSIVISACLTISLLRSPTPNIRTKAKVGSPHASGVQGSGA